MVDKATFLLLTVVFALFFLLGPAETFAQTVAEPTKPSGGAQSQSGSAALKEAVIEHDSTIDVWTIQVRALGQMVADETSRDVELKELPGILEELRVEVRDFTSELAPKLKEAQLRLNQLGPAPKDGEPAEAVEIAEQRAELGTEVAAYDSLIKQADVLLVQVGQLIDAANQARRERFTRTLLEPASNYYTSEFWQRAFASVPNQIRGLTGVAGVWFAGVMSYGPWRILAVLAATLIGGVLTRIAARSAATGLAKKPSKDEEPTRSRLGAAALIGGVFACAPALAAIAVFYLTMIAVDLVPAKIDSPVVEILLVLASAVLLITVIWYALLPAKRDMRLIAIEHVASRRLALLLSALVAVWAIDYIFVQSESGLFAPYPLIVLRSFAVAATIAILLVGLLSVPVGRGRRAGRLQYRGWPAWLFSLLGLAAGFIAFSLLFGYVALARFAATQLVITGGVLLLMYLLHLLGEHVFVASDPHDTADVSAGDESEGAGPSLLGTLRFTLSLLFDVAILMVGGTILLLLWRFDWVEMKSWIGTAFFGIQIGGLTISLQAILIAIGVFATGLVLTRVIQRWLIKRTAISGQMESGVRQSLNTGIGYLGFALATIAAISAMGIDFSNLAIVAGALSVGIGFGLQSIFNNFASGLILLVERPIKVGDWITVGADEGYVRKISVRSTEIETMQRQSVIIPNANLITETVTNWMHTDKIGRVEIPLGVSYGTDVDLLRTTLLAVADANPSVVKKPAPSVFFAGYGDSSLDFELRAFLRDIGGRMSIMSDLRFAIWFALKEAEIQIPFPQRDLHIKDFDDIEKMRGSAVKRRRQNGPRPGRGRTS